VTIVKKFQKFSYFPEYAMVHLGIADLTEIITFHLEWSEEIRYFERIGRGRLNFSGLYSKRRVGERTLSDNASLGPFRLLSLLGHCSFKERRGKSHLSGLNGPFVARFFNRCRVFQRTVFIFVLGGDNRSRICCS
jgi:hypothetical protein